MQYILTEAEYRDLQNKAKEVNTKLVETINLLCKEVATYKPVLWGWESEEEPKPWGCIHEEEQEWYCDSCPVIKYCKMPKEFSK